MAVTVTTVAALLPGRCDQRWTHIADGHDVS